MSVFNWLTEANIYNSNMMQYKYLSNDCFLQI